MSCEPREDHPEPVAGNRHTSPRDPSDRSAGYDTLPFRRRAGVMPGEASETSRGKGNQKTVVEIDTLPLAFLRNTRPGMTQPLPLAFLRNARPGMTQPL